MVSVSERVGTIICFQVRQSGQSRGGTKSDLERAGSRSRAARRASLSLPSAPCRASDDIQRQWPRQSVPLAAAVAGRSSFGRQTELGSLRKQSGQS